MSGREVNFHCDAITSLHSQACTCILSHSTVNHRIAKRFSASKCKLWRSRSASWTARAAWIRCWESNASANNSQTHLRSRSWVEIVYWKVCKISLKTQLSAPAEPEYQAPPRRVQPQPAQKHYRIIFIKAPSPPAPVLPPIAEPPRQEEKTIVYVLVKKPDDMPEIVLPTPAATVATKPEVYFIRYKTQEEDFTMSTMQPEVITEAGPYPYWRAETHPTRIHVMRMFEFWEFPKNFLIGFSLFKLKHYTLVG